MLCSVSPDLCCNRSLILPLYTKTAHIMPHFFPSICYPQKRGCSANSCNSKGLKPEAPVLTPPLPPLLPSPSPPSPPFPTLYPTLPCREISLLRELCRHPCVVALRDIQYATADVLYMVFEYMDQVQQQPSLSLATIWFPCTAWRAVNGDCNIFKRILMRRVYVFFECMDQVVHVHACARFRLMMPEMS